MSSLARLLNENYRKTAEKKCEFVSRSAITFESQILAASFHKTDSREEIIDSTNKFLDNKLSLC